MKKVIAFGVIIVLAFGIVLIIIHDNRVKQHNAAAVFSCVTQNNEYYGSIINEEESTPDLNSQVGQTLQAEQTANSQCGK